MESGINEMKSFSSRRTGRYTLRDNLVEVNATDSIGHSFLKNTLKSMRAPYHEQHGKGLVYFRVHLEEPALTEYLEKLMEYLRTQGHEVRIC